MASDVVANLGTVILAAGALGTAAFGVVDGLKVVPWIGLLGYRHLRSQLGLLMPAVNRAYGAETAQLLEAQYRGGRGQGDLPRTLRQGYRIGLPALDGGEIRRIAAEVGIIRGDALVGAAGMLREGVAPDGKERETLSRFEVAVDARIEAALALAEVEYVSALRILAGGLSVVIAVGVAALIQDEIGSLWLLKALLIGLIAVPVAPVAKDLAAAIGEAANALRGRP